MLSVYIRVVAIILVCLHALSPTAHPQPGDYTRRRKAARLYQVSTWDEESHRKKIGFIDKTGKLVIGFDRLPETTINVGEFHEGRALIVVADKERKELGSRLREKVGFIDETGKVVIAPRFDQVRDFSEGLAFAWGDGFLGFIDREGREVFKVNDISVGDFHDGLASIGPHPSETNGGYIDRSGLLAIKRQYRFAEDFSEGLAGVEVGGRFGGPFGFINTKGEMIIPARFVPHKRGDRFLVLTSRFSEGLACVREAGTGYGYINKRGEFVIPPQSMAAQEFSEGLAWVATYDGKTGWIDRWGRWVVTLAVNGIHPSGLKVASTSVLNDWRFSEGLVPFAIYSENKALRGYIDRKGKIVIQPKLFTSAGRFVGGLARVSFYESSEYWEGKMGYFDERIKQFREEKYGYIDRTGRFVWPAK